MKFNGYGKYFFNNSLYEGEFKDFKVDFLFFISNRLTEKEY